MEPSLLLLRSGRTRTKGGSRWQWAPGGMQPRTMSVSCAVDSMGPAEAIRRAIFLAAGSSPWSVWQQWQQQQ